MEKTNIKISRSKNIFIGFYLALWQMFVALLLPAANYHKKIYVNAFNNIGLITYACF